MTVLSVVQDAATDLGLDIPDEVYASTSRGMVEMKALLNRTADMIARRHDWSALKAIHTLTGDGATEDFDLPSDFSRMPKDAQLWSSTNTMMPLEHVLSANEWLGVVVQNFTPVVGSWIVYGGQMHIRTARASGETVKFFYLSRNIAADSGGTSKAAFTADDDTFRLSEKVLTLGIISAWKAKKGHDYAEEAAAFEDALAVEIGADKGPSVITVGQQRVPGNTQIPYPLALGS